MRDSASWVTILVCLTSALLNVAAHWFPWQAIPALADASGRLRRVLAYVYGTATIVAGMAVWISAMAGGGKTITPWGLFGVLVLIVAAAGLGTVAAYLVDELIERRALAQDLADIEKRIGL